MQVHHAVEKLMVVLHVIQEQPIMEELKFHFRICPFLEQLQLTIRLLTHYICLKPLLSSGGPGVKVTVICGGICAR